VLTRARELVGGRAARLGAQLGLVLLLQPRLPLAKTFFADEAAWRATLPQGGKFYTKNVDSRYNEWV
jgi:hypothetical protein